MMSEELVKSIGKPSVGEVLKLVRWLGKTTAQIPPAPELADPTKAGFTLLSAIVEHVSEQDLLELAKILLRGKCEDLTVDDLELGWLSEAIAVWVEQIDIARILKNMRRVTAALK